MGFFGKELDKFAPLTYDVLKVAADIIALVNMSPESRVKANEAMGLIKNLAAILVGVPK